MKITVTAAVLLTITALPAVAQESTGEQVKHGAQKAGETVKVDVQVSPSDIH